MKVKIARVGFSGHTVVCSREKANTPPRTIHSWRSPRKLGHVVLHHGLEQGPSQGFGEGICQVIRCRNSLRHNDLEFGELTSIVAGNPNVFVGLVVDRVEHERHNTRAVHVNGNWCMRLSSVEFVEEVDQPLGFLCSQKQRGVLGMVGARGDIGMEFAVPGQDRATKIEDVAQSALGRIRTVCMRENPRTHEH